MATAGSGVTRTAISRTSKGSSNYWRYKYAPKIGSESEIPAPFGEVNVAPRAITITPSTTITTTVITPTSAAVTVTKTGEAVSVSAPPVETQVITATTVTTSLPPASQVPATIPPLQIWMDQFKILSGQLVPSANASNALPDDSQRASDQLNSWQYNYGDRLLASAKARSQNSI